LVTGETVYIYSADYATRNVQEAAQDLIDAANGDLTAYGEYASVLQNYANGLQADAE
jgi:hypothetical protein